MGKRFAYHVMGCPDCGRKGAQLAPSGCMFPDYHTKVEGPAPQPLTLMGYPVRFDPTLPPNTIEMRGANGTAARVTFGPPLLLNHDRTQAMHPLHLALLGAATGLERDWRYEHIGVVDCDGNAL